MRLKIKAVMLVAALAATSPALSHDGNSELIEELIG